MADEPAAMEDVQAKVETQPNADEAGEPAQPAEPAEPAPGEDKTEEEKTEERPTKRVRKKRAWDAAPTTLAAAASAAASVVAARGLAAPAPAAAELPPLTPEQTARLQKAQNYALQQSINYRQSTLQLPGASSMEALKQQQEQAARQKAIALMSRIYVGSIGFDTTDQDLLRAFAPFGFVKAINMAWDPISQKHKGFVFIEYEVPEAAALAVESMVNASVAGRAIKVGRPNNAPQAGPMMEKITAEARKENQIYVGSIHPELSEEDIQSVFEPFGNVLECKLAPDSAAQGKHRGFGFIKFDREASADEAVAAMNMFDLGGQFLRVCRTMASPVPFPDVSGSSTAITDLSGAELPHVTQAKALAAMTGAPNPVLVASQPGMAAAGAAAPAQPAAAVAQGQSASLRNEEEVSISGSSQRFEIMRKLQQREKGQSRVVVLRNMVGVEDIDENLEDEVKGECSKYGPVDRVVIYKDQPDSTTQAVSVKIFVSFGAQSAAEAAEKALHQRWFGGRVIVAEQFPEDKFNAKDFSG
eukprot:m.177674 g.177674  ORF g.177674 m.177674 type:complete len:529 (+) comp17969_c0_seq3:2148-3734(+)